MTQRLEALKGNITQAMEQVAKDEKMSPEEIRVGLAQGTISIPFNPLHKDCKPLGVGKGLRTKVNANIGTSADFQNIDDEMNKLKSCIEAKADTVMDLSTGGDINLIRRQILDNCPLPLGTVPIYQASLENRMTPEGMFEVVEEQAKDGVDFMTIHCGVTFESIDCLKKQPRLINLKECL